MYKKPPLDKSKNRPSQKKDTENKNKTHNRSLNKKIEVKKEKSFTSEEISDICILNSRLIEVLNYLTEHENKSISLKLTELERGKGEKIYSINQDIFEGVKILAKSDSEFEFLDNLLRCNMLNKSKENEILFSGTALYLNDLFKYFFYNKDEQLNLIQNQKTEEDFVFIKNSRKIILLKSIIKKCNVKKSYKLELENLILETIAKNNKVLKDIAFKSDNKNKDIYIENNKNIKNLINKESRSKTP